MLVLIEKMALLTILMGIGYLCAKLKIVGPEFNKGLSKIVINVLLAGMILSSVINKQMSMVKADVIFGIGMLTLMMLISMAIAYITPSALRIKGGDTGMYRLLTAFSNVGFVGFPIVAAVYNEDMVFFAALTNIPFNILLYTIGVMQLQESNGEKNFNFKKIINMPIIATLLATVIFIFEIPMPVLVDDVVDTVSAGCVPLSMMSVGLSLGNVSIKEALTQPRLYAINFVRLLVIPIVVCGILRFFVTDPVMLGTIVIVAACPPAIICPILGIEYGRDGVEGSEAVFIGSVLSILTIPAIIALLGLG